MKRITIFAALLPVLLSATAAIPPDLPPLLEKKRAEVIAPSEVRMALPGGKPFAPHESTLRRSLNGEWNFSGVENSEKPFTETGAQWMMPEFDDSKWGTIPVPLAWGNKYKEASDRSKPYSRGFYRRRFELSETDLAARRAVLKFDCVGYDAKVFINGREAGGHHGDFTPFELDVTDFVKPGGNLVAVRVLSDLGPAFGVREKAFHAYGSQWWTDNIKAGIWQDVSLELTPELRIRELLVNPDFAASQVSVDYVIENHSPSAREVRLTTAVTDAMRSNPNAAIGGSELPLTLAPGANSGSLTVKLDHPAPWSVETPYLYFLSAALCDGDGRALSAETRRFGFREFTARNGKFYLNGEEIYLFGENISSKQYGGFGRTPEQESAMLEEFLLKMRNLGYVMIRTAHMPIIPRALELADEVGVMIFNEWAWCFTTAIDHEKFEKHNLPELAEFVRATYNHPSVVMWSLGNEVAHGADKRIADQMNLQSKLVRKLDRQKRPISSFSGAAGWISYGRNYLDTDVHDYHTYTALSAPWTEFGDESDRIYGGLLEIFGGSERLSRPLVAWENVGFSWGFTGAENKNPDFRRGDAALYGKYASGPTSWGQPRGIGYTGCMSLAEAVDPAVPPGVPMTRFGRRIFELYRLDSRWSGFAPWFGVPDLAESRLWTQPLLPCLTGESGRMPRNLYSGETSHWKFTAVNNSGADYGALQLEAVMIAENGDVFPAGNLTLPGVGKHSSKKREFTLAVPGPAPGFYQLRIRLLAGDGRIEGRNFYDVFVQSRAAVNAPLKAERPVVVYDTGSAGNVALLVRTLAGFGIEAAVEKDFRRIPEDAVLMVPPEIEEQRITPEACAAAEIFLRRGGVLLVLEQKSPESSLPGNFAMTADAQAYSDMVLPEHPVFRGLSERNFDTWDNPDHGYVVKNSYAPFTRNVLAAKGVRLGRKDVGMSVVEATFGKGRIFYSQLEVFRSVPQDSSAATYLHNLIAYITAPSAYSRETGELISSGSANFRVVPERIVPLDLTGFVNRGFADESDNDGQGGWTDQGDNDFRRMPLGDQLAAGVPFRIIDPAENGGKSCIVLRGTGRPEFADAVTGIRIGRKLSRLFFLHTAAWGSAKEAGRYRIRYRDGKTAEIELNGNRNIGDFWNCGTLPEAKVGIVRPNGVQPAVCAFVMEWNNPRPEVAIESLDFLSPLYRQDHAIDYLPSATAVPILIALSGEAVSEDVLDIGKRTTHVRGAREIGSTVSGSGRRTDEGWEIAFKESPAGETPAAFLAFDPAGMSKEYRMLVIEVRSDAPGTVELVFPDKEWKARQAGYLRLEGDGEYHTCRLAIGRELRRYGKMDFSQLRGELFFFYRDGREQPSVRPALNLTVRKITLE